MTNNIPREWPDNKLYRKSFRVEFSVYIGIIILLLMSATGYLLTRKYVETVTYNVAEKFLIQARSYSGSAAKLIVSSETPDELLLNNICKNLSADNKDMYWAGITNRDKRFIAHTNLSKVVQETQFNRNFKKQFATTLRSGETAEIIGDTLFITAPVEENGLQLGYLALAASTKQIQAAKLESITTVSTITIIVMLIGIPVTMVILNKKLKPIRTIIDNLKRVDFNDININIPVRSKNEFGYLSETLEVMGQKLNLAQEDLIVKERISRELEIAREIQKNLLPSEFPESRLFDIGGAYQSALEVGGDYYDFIDYGDEYLSFLVADVSGKSLPGMLVMLMTRDIVRKHSALIKDPAELLIKTNDELLQNIKRNTFVTMFYGLLNKSNGRFTFASAGHNPLIRLKGSDNSIEQIKTKGFPLGMMKTEAFAARIETGNISLEQGDWIVQYTDGINEAVNSGNEEYGMDRFIDEIKNGQKSDCKQFIDNIIENHNNFVGDLPQFDDITLMALKWNGISVDKPNINCRDTANASG